MTASDGSAAALLLGVLALAGCALLPKPPPPKPPPKPVAHEAPLPLQPHVRPAPSGSAAAAGRLTHTPQAAPAPALPPLQVVGLSQDAVRRLLGQPASQAASGASQTWTYQGSGCSVNIVFYYDVTRAGFFALSEQLAGGGDGGTCLAGIHDAQTS